MLTELSAAFAALDATAAKLRLQGLIVLNGDGDPSITAFAPDPTPCGRRRERLFKAEARRWLFGRGRARR